VITTVSGNLKEEELGITMMHEHLVPQETIPKASGFDRFVEPLTVEMVIEQLTQAKSLGLSSVVDCTPHGLYRNPEILEDISAATNVNIVASAGFYKEPRIPSFVYRMSLNELTDFIVKELEEGIEGTGIRAGIIKVGSSMKMISRVEEKVIRAAARAHRKTGVPITTHSTVGTMGVEQVEILEEEGADFQHVVIGHCALNESFAYCETIIKHGASVGFDTIGKERFEYVRMSTAGINRYEFEKEAYHIADQGVVERILALVEAGYAAHIVLSSDMTRKEAYINPDTFGSYGYSYLLARFVPLLQKAGVTEAAIQQMLVENPQRILGVHP
jgi:predicted metal-dependent phosphotriesterase family hydrolase